MQTRASGRTAARRSLVRASVRERLAALAGTARAGAGAASGAGAGAGARAGAPPIVAPRLSLFGDDHQLEYFEDDDEEQPTASEGAVTAVAARPTRHVISAFRQVRLDYLTFTT